MNVCNMWKIMYVTLQSGKNAYPIQSEKDDYMHIHNKRFLVFYFYLRGKHVKYIQLTTIVDMETYQPPLWKAWQA